MVLGQGDEEARAGSLDPVEAERIRLLELDQVTKVRNLCVVLHVCMYECMYCMCVCMYVCKLYLHVYVGVNFFLCMKIFLFRICIKTHLYVLCVCMYCIYCMYVLYVCMYDRL